MNIKIGENIKRLRVNKNITQEKLANHLQITYQTISKWERDEGYPDITMLIPLANYFDVTVDELLGTDAAKNEVKIQEYINEYDRLSNIGYNDEKYEMITKAYQEFPHDWRIISKYIDKLTYGEKDGFKSNLDEIQKLCEDILDRCNIDSIRYPALNTFSSIYQEKGDEPKALEILDKLPHIFHTSTNLKAFFYNWGDERRLKYTREAINEFIEQSIVLLRNVILDDNSLSMQEKIKGFQDIIDIVKLVYGEDKYCGFMNYHLTELYIWLGNRYIQNNEYEKGIECLSTGLDYAIKDDAIPYGVTKLEGIFVKGVIFDRKNVYAGLKCNGVKRELDYIREWRDTENSIYADVKNHPKFIELFEKYEPYAKECK
ncbi:MAG: helix-turn-helix domain-containing protein [Oscillospiraceae bacterium]|nr:helix-turn-helix domain-containing protein [Oscillospiraceae bacterium]